MNKRSYTGDCWEVGSWMRKWQLCCSNCVYPGFSAFQKIKSLSTLGSWERSHSCIAVEWLSSFLLLAYHSLVWALFAWGALLTAHGGGGTSPRRESQRTLEMAYGILAFTLPGSVTFRRSFNLKRVFPYLSWGERQTVNICWMSTVCQALSCISGVGNLM